MKTSIRVGGPNTGGREHFDAIVELSVEAEKLGVDRAWSAEAWGMDAVSPLAFLAARTSRMEFGTGIMQVCARTPASTAMTAMSMDTVTNGRFILGLGNSGPQVVEGFHGVPYEKPMPRIRDYINVCRMVTKREKVVYDGPTVQVPLPDGQGTGLGKPLKLINHPVREHVPIFCASLMGLSVTATAEHADGWLPIFFDPEKFHNVWGEELKKGTAKRDPSLGPVQISAGGMVAIGEDLVGGKANAVLAWTC